MSYLCRHFFGCVLLLLVGTYYAQAQEISNLQVGYVPAIKRFEVYFDLDVPSQKEVDLRLYIQEFPEGARKQIDPTKIHGLSLKGLKAGYNYYFQVETGDLTLAPTEYVFQLTPTVLLERGQFQKVDSSNVKVAVEEAPRKPIQLIKPIEQNLTYATLGISPFSPGGEQSNLTISAHVGKIQGGWGYGLTVLYGLEVAPSTNYTVMGTLIDKYTTPNSNYKFTKETKTTRLSVIPSFLYGMNEHIYLRAGMGYGSRSLYWAADEFNFAGTKTGSIWAKNSYASLSGLELEGGINLIFKRIHIASGINYLGLLKSADTKAYSDVWLSFGLNF